MTRRAIVLSAFVIATLITCVVLLVILSATPDRTTPHLIPAPMPEPTPTSTTPPAPPPAPSQSPTPPAPDLEEDNVKAADLAHEAAVAATLAIFYSDSQETPERRAARLAPLFVPGSDNITQPPLLTLEHANTTTEAELISVTPLATDDPTTQQLRVVVTWGAAWWPNDNGTTSYVQGDMTLIVTVTLHEGAWLARSVELEA